MALKGNVEVSSCRIGGDETFAGGQKLIILKIGTC